MKTSNANNQTWRERLFRSALPYVISDIFAIVTAYYITLFFRFFSHAGKQLFAWINTSFGVRETAEVGFMLENFYLYNAPRILILLSATLIFIYAYLNLYAGRRFIRNRHRAWAIAMSNLIALGAFYAYFYLTRNDFHPRSVFATLLAINVVVTILLRSATSGLLRQSRLTRCRVLLVGEGPEAEFIDRYITLQQPEGLEIVARFPTPAPLPAELLLDRIQALVKEHKTQLILCAEKQLSVAEIMQLLELAESLGQEVKILSNKLNVLINEANIPSDFFMELPLVHFAVSPVGTPGQRVRQFIFKLFTWFLLIQSLPFMLVIALLIKATSKGPVFFMQDRIGISRTPFRMYKFRTMHDRAEELQAQIEEFNESGEGLFKIKRDPRVTWIGRILRRFSLDELPQLINVVKGDMTLVGPRPLPRRDFENYYEEWHYSRHSGLPGLTCLWQVSGRSDISFHNMCILDDYYLRNQNAMLDLKILLRTVGVVLFAKGAY